MLFKYIILILNIIKGFIIIYITYRYIIYIICQNWIYCVIFNLIYLIPTNPSSLKICQKQIGVSSVTCFKNFFYKIPN